MKGQGITRLLTGVGGYGSGSPFDRCLAATKTFNQGNLPMWFIMFALGIVTFASLFGFTILCERV